MGSRKPLLLGFDSNGRPFHLHEDERLTHAHVIGSSGSGKSKFLEHLMRQDVRNGQGFCLIDPHGTLYDAVLDWCGHHVYERSIIQLNVSQPDKIVGFNPFRRSPRGDISVQVDNRMIATMHAWGVTDTDQTPTLARTLRLIYTVMLEHNLGFPQVHHLIDFNAFEVRSQLIESLSTPLIKQEWLELQQLKAREFREEILSAKNRLFKLLTSATLARFMGLADSSINISQIIEEGGILLVNLAPSDQLSLSNAAVLGALLVNEFFECAMRRKAPPGEDLPPYYLYLDEFQTFVSPVIASMLDQIRKFGIFMVLAHQRFGQIDEDIMDAVLTNCKIKAVFGGLRADSARLMAEELFIGKLNPMKIKAAIYQTKFWPLYSREKVYTRGSAYGTSSMHTSSSGRGSSEAAASFTGAGTNTSCYTDWFGITQPTGFGSESETTGSSAMSGTSETFSESAASGDNSSESESEADIPIFIPVPFQELSSVQFTSIEEQLHQMTAALKEQFPRHCFIKVQNQETQPMLVPRIEQPCTSEENLAWYREYQLKRQRALPATEVDRLLISQEDALLKKVESAASEAAESSEASGTKKKKKKPAPASPGWDRAGEDKD